MGCAKENVAQYYQVSNGVAGLNPCQRNSRCLDTGKSFGIGERQVGSFCVEQIKCVDKVTCGCHSLWALLDNMEVVNPGLKVINGDHSPCHIDYLFGECRCHDKELSKVKIFRRQFNGVLHGLHHVLGLAVC